MSTRRGPAPREYRALPCGLTRLPEQLAQRQPRFGSIAPAERPGAHRARLQHVPDAGLLERPPLLAAELQIDAAAYRRGLRTRNRGNR